VSRFPIPTLALLVLACCSGPPAKTPNADTRPRLSPPTAQAPAGIGEDVALGELDDGRRLLLAGELTAAKAAFEAATHHPKAGVAALVGLAETEFQLGRFSAAEALAAKAVSAGAGVGAHVVLGNICFKLRDYEGAARSYEAALALDGGNAEARRNLAVARKMANARGGERR